MRSPRFMINSKSAHYGSPWSGFFVSFLPEFIHVSSEELILCLKGSLRGTMTAPGAAILGKPLLS